ncbi:MAG TPA: ATP-binding protein [Actinomycetota bacterium]|nr:ATP-binding protein [Actinomycetota bacterium]
MKQSLRRWFGVKGPRVVVGYAVALGGTAVASAALLALRGEVSTTNVVLVFLVVVVAAAANGGLWPGLTAAWLGFLAFDLLFLPPYGHLKVHDQEDYVSLAVYLLIALVVSVLVSTRERRQAQAERRERETRTLYELSSRLLVHDGLAATLEQVASAVRSLFELDGCAVLLAADDGRARLVAVDGDVTADLVEAAGAAALDAAEGLVPLPVPGAGEGAARRALAVPLRASGTPVGAMVLVADGSGPMQLGEPERRVLSAFANQAALAVELDRRQEERAQARALAETDRLRTALLNSVSHDLRTPLSSIKASASSLLDPTVEWSPQERGEFLETIDQESDRLTRLVHNLLDMSRIEVGALDPRLVETALADVTGPVVRLARSKTGQPIRVDIPDDLPAVLVDPVRLDQVLTNLLDNARRYADGGAVTLQGRAVDGRVELRVVDHGPGIPVAERERVFGQFYRLRRNGRTPPDGTGMGLAISRGIVEALGGTIRVEDTPGGGATFVVSLSTGPGGDVQ